MKRDGSSACCRTSKRAIPASRRLLRAFSRVALPISSTRSGLMWMLTMRISIEQSHCTSLLLACAWRKVPQYDALAHTLAVLHAVRPENDFGVGIEQPQPPHLPIRDADRVPSGRWRRGVGPRHFGEAQFALEIGQNDGVERHLPHSLVAQPAGEPFHILAPVEIGIGAHLFRLGAD